MPVSIYEALGYEAYAAIFAAVVLVELFAQRRVEMASAAREREAAARGEGPLGKAAHDEPVFILRAQDMLASGLVDQWATLARQSGVPMDKVNEARLLAKQMRAWPNRKIPD